MDEHDLVVAIKSLADELGQTPTVSQFRKHIKNGQVRIENSSFRTYARLVESAGLAPSRNSRRITNEIFEKPIERHLEEYVPRSTVERKPYPTIAVISDIHWPFENKKVLSAFYEYVGDTKPEHATINGDAWDMYSHSKFPRSQNIFTPRDEEKMALESNKNFWAEIQRRSPSTNCVQMLGNHDIRPIKRALESYPAAEDWVAKYLNDLFTFPGVKTFYDHREEFILNDIAIFHGYASQLGAHRDFTLMNTINGHTHKGGTVFRHIRGQTLWELNSGVAGDPESKGLSYTPQRIHIMTPGFGAVDRRGPRFVSI